MEGCIFCKIARRQIPSSITAESDLAIAFRDNNPQAPVHVLVIPKKHIPGVADIVSEHSDILGDMVRLANKCAELEGVSKSGYRLVFNSGPDAGQSVDHLHLHMLGKRRLNWPPG